MEPLSWLEQHYPKEKFNASLNRIHQALNLLKISRENFNKIITVAGTNGKGSVARQSYRNLLTNKWRAALWTSPHLVSINERFSFDGELVSSEGLLEVFIRSDKLLKKSKIDLSFYEFTFLCFLILAIEKGISNLILEVGLGGRLDATSCLIANVCILTSVSRDHTEILGNSYKKILLEKIAIAHPNSILISAVETRFLRKLVKEYCQKRNIALIEKKNYHDLSQLNNSIVSSLCEQLSIRFQPEGLNILNELGEKYFYNSAHNVAAVRKFVGSLTKGLSKSSFNSPSLLLLSYSHRDDKDLEYMSKLFLKLNNIFDDIFLTHIDQFKAAKEDQIIKVCNKLNIKFIDKEKINDLIKKYNCVCLSGSNYFIGSFVREYISR